MDQHSGSRDNIDAHRYHDDNEYGDEYGDEYGSSGDDFDFADDEASQIIREGWLTKSNPQGKRWKKRYVDVGGVERWS